MERRTPHAGAAVAAALTAAAALAVCDSRYRLELTEYSLYCPRLPAAFDGFRIVQLSDLHGARFGRDNERLVRAVARLQPDLIALTGDLAGRDMQLAAVEGLLRGLRGIAPCCAVSGNHEWAGACHWPLRELLDAYDVRSLENCWTCLERGGARIVVAGAEDPYGWTDRIPPEELAARLREAYPEDFVLWLGHRNDWIRKYPALPVDLILSGHAHGGIVRLPGLGGLLNNDHSLGAEYEAGLYHSGRFTLLVSRGLGNSVPIPRLFNRPEIVSLQLRSGQA